MTTHELLRVMRNVGWVTPHQIGNEFSLSSTGVFSRLEVLRKSGFVTRRQIQTESGGSLYHFGITRTGLKKLAYFDEVGCKRPECSLG